MPSIALRGLVKAESVHTDKRGAILALSLYIYFLNVGAPNLNVTVVVYFH